MIDVDEMVMSMASQISKMEEERDRLKDALDHALKGDMDPEDKVIINQILDGTPPQEDGDER